MNGGMKHDKETSKIEHLKHRLYSRSHPVVVEDTRSQIHMEEPPVNEKWDDEDDEAPQAEAPKKRFSIFSKLFVGSVIFFLVSIAVAFGIFAKGFNKISPNNVDISVIGPVSVAGGEEFGLEIVLRNENAIDLDDVVLTVSFPDGSRSPNNLALPLLVEKLDMGSVEAGKTARKTVRAVIFGEKDTLKDIKVTADYRIMASNAAFQKEKTYQIGIKSSPIIVTVHYPKEIDAGEELEFKIEATSNTNADLHDVIVRAEYPFGFVFRGSDPEPYFENGVWKLGDMKPLEKRFITVKGHLEAQNNEERTFRFYSGRASDDDDRMIGVPLTSSIASVTIKKPDLGLGLVLEGTDNDIAVFPGERTQGRIEWRNNMPLNIVNAQIEAKITGGAFNEENVVANHGGFYRSLDNTILWTKTTNTALSQIMPGEEKSVTFTFAAKGGNREYVSSIQNPEITIDVTMSGNRLVEGGLPVKVVAKTTKRVRVTTELGLTSRAVYSVGPFKNTGPIPPKVDNETTYTVMWSATNSFNGVSGAQVRATLPPYVKWVGVSSPASERVSFNPTTQEIVWDLGEMKRGAGYLSSPREVAFQVAVTPSITHYGGPAIIMQSPMITGRDNFTGVSIQSSARELTTQLSTDPNVGFNTGSVVK